MGLLFYTDEYEPEVCKQMNKSFKKLYIWLLVAFIMASYSITAVVVARHRFSDYNISYDYTSEQYIQVKSDFAQELLTLEYEEMTRGQILAQAKKEAPVKFYLFFNVRPPKAGAAGGTFLVPRIIVVDPSLDDTHYIVATVHELLHLKNFTISETYTQFQTFVTLYESANPLFHRAALILALEIFRGAYAKDYTCTGNIVNYITERS